MAQVNSGPGQKHNKVIVPRPVGGRMHKDTYKLVTSNQILVRSNAHGPAKWRQLDGGSATSIVSREFLKRWYPDAKIEAQLSQHGALCGFVPDSKIVSNYGVRIPLFLLLHDNKQA